MEQGRSFGDLLKQHRLAAGLTHEALAERATLSARAISDLERGVSRRPRRETIDLLAQALQLTPGARIAFEGAARAPVGAAPDPMRTSGDVGSVPVHLTSFVGRETELRAARDLFGRRGARLVTLTGPGGAGKSRLAAQIAAELAADLEDGACYVELAPVAAVDDVVPAIARALGVAQPDGSARPGDLVDAIRDRELLLVVDNVEHLLGAAPVLSELLKSCPRLVVLATSRASLQLSGERELPIPPLPVPPLDRAVSADEIVRYDAVRLFADRATYVDPAFTLTAEDAPVVAAICARLDGLPLALELAAARIKMLTPDALLQRLDGVASGSALRLLTRGSRDVPPHQRTLRATLLWSYDLLTPAEQRLLRRLAIFAGGCTLRSAEAICRPDASADDAPQDILEGLGSLLDKSLLYLEEGPDGQQRFMLLETVRELGLEQLRAHGELEAVARDHAQYYLNLSTTSGPLLWAEPARINRAIAEYHNLHDALHWLFLQG